MSNADRRARDDRPFEQRLMSRFEVDANSCWVWQGTLTWGGYGQISRQGRNVIAHRAVWEHERGPIAPGMTIDHLCLNRACVNPDHLEVVTYSENNRRRFLKRSPVYGAAAA
jgi:hypothetical protein